MEYPYCKEERGKEKFNLFNKSNNYLDSAGDNGNQFKFFEELRKEIAQGFLYSHTRASTNTGKALEVASFCYALIELLEEKGIISIEELDGRKKVVATRLVKKFAEKGMGAFYQEPEYDKYKFNKETKVDCQSYIHLCKAACCRIFSFALSRQDVKEGIIKWDLGHPFMVAKDDDGNCKHLDRISYQCAIRDNRPVPCRAFDCRKDKRIWLNFEKKIINPDLKKLSNKGNGKQLGSMELVNEKARGNNK